jgi:hypothetical protein
VVGIALFGLLRLSIARKGTDDDWQALVAYAKRLPQVVNYADVESAAWADALAAAPPGLLVDGGGGPLTPANAYERVRIHQASLQSEMKWYVRKLTSPFQWFLAGIRGVLLLPLGLAFDVDAGTRAQRREYEAHPDFQRAATALLAVGLFVLLLAGWFGAQQALEAWHRYQRANM